MSGVPWRDDDMTPNPEGLSHRILKLKRYAPLPFFNHDALTTCRSQLSLSLSDTACCRLHSSG